MSKTKTRRNSSKQEVIPLIRKKTERKRIKSCQLQPSEIEKMISSEYEIEREPFHPGVYRVITNKVAYYAKATDALFLAFAFKDINTAEHYLDIYRECARQSIYHPDSVFQLRYMRRRSQPGIISLMPVLEKIYSYNDMSKRIKRLISEKIEKAEKVLESLGHVFAYDNDYCSNWGLKNKQPFLFDLHLTEKIFNTVLNSYKVRQIE
jgi:hypothetical protein